MKARTPVLPDEAAVRSLHARARVQADHFRLPLRDRVWRGAAGDFAGRGAGSSLDFHDHRLYMPGDDVRHINWQAYARTGLHTMKLFREEVRPLVDVACDVSHSMFYDPTKAARVIELFAFALEGSLRAGATPRVWLARGGHFAPVPEEAALAGAWTGFLPGPEEEGAGRAALDRIPWRARALRVVVSDLLFPGDPLPVCGALAAAGGRGVIYCPHTRAERDPDWDGNVEFVDVETGTRRADRVEPSALERYRLAYGRHFALWKAAATRCGVVTARVAAEGSFAQALQQEALPNGAVEAWV